MSITHVQKFDFEVENPNYVAVVILVLLQSRTPVLTGRLRAGWSVSVDVDDFRETILTIVNQVDYAGFLEYGTRRLKARAMLTDSLGAIETILRNREVIPPIGLKAKRNLAHSIKPPPNIPYHLLSTKNLSKINLRPQSLPIKTPPGFPLQTRLPTSKGVQKLTNKLLKLRKQL